MWFYFANMLIIIEMRIYDFETHQKFLEYWIQARSNGGRGELLKIAAHAKLHSSTLSQIQKGSREFTPEQAVLVCDYMGLSEPETRFFLLLLQRAKCSSPLLKTLIEKQIKEAQENSVELAHVLVSDQKISDEAKAVFYSNWFYSAVRILSSIPGYQTLESLEVRLGLPRALLAQVISFLKNTGLCVENSGKLAPGPSYTHLESTSPLISRHHGNWRIKAMECHPSLGKQELCYTAPMSISTKDAEKVRGLAVAFLEEVQKLRKDSDSEEAYCLNLDWFKI